MSSGNDLKEHQLEPVHYTPNARCEFRLPAGRIFSTDLFLANLGVFRANNQGDYGRFAGVYGVLTNVTLYDGNVVLTNINDCGRWAGFKMLNKSGDYSQGVGRYYNYGNTSTIFDQSDVRSTQELVKRTSSSTKDIYKIQGAKLTEGIIADIETKTQDVGLSGTAKGMLRMRHVFDMLNSMPFIDTSFFKDFRIVCELSADPVRILRKNLGSDLTTCRPLLVAHELVDEDLKAGILGKTPNFAWNEIEEDRVEVAEIDRTALAAAASRTADQAITYHINGFNNKSLGRMLVMKAPTNLINQRESAGSGARGRVCGNGPFNSTSFLGEREQIRINGRNVFARSGISGSNRRLAHMVDSWGNCAMNPFAAGLAYIEMKNVTRWNILGQWGNALIGFEDFLGVDFAGERCTDLQIDFARTGVHMEGSGAGALDSVNCSKYNNAHALVLIAEAKKKLVRDATQPRGYSIQHV